MVLEKCTSNHVASWESFSDCLYLVAYEAFCDLSPGDSVSYLISVSLLPLACSGFFSFFDMLSLISKPLTMMLSSPVRLFAPCLLSYYLPFKSQIEHLFIRPTWWLDWFPRHMFLYLLIVPLSQFLLHCSTIDWAPWKQDSCLSWSFLMPNT